MKHSKLGQLFKSKNGQGTVEYILIIAVVVGLVMMFGKTFKGKLEGVTNDLFGKVSSGINSTQ